MRERARTHNTHTHTHPHTHTLTHTHTHTQSESESAACRYYNLSFKLTTSRTSAFYPSNLCPPSRRRSGGPTQTETHPEREGRDELDPSHTSQISSWRTSEVVLLYRALCLQRVLTFRVAEHPRSFCCTSILHTHLKFRVAEHPRWCCCTLSL